MNKTDSDFVLKLIFLIIAFPLILYAGGKLLVLFIQ